MGLLLSLASKLGLLRYWWVAAKLALNVMMSLVLVMLLLGPFRDITTGRAPLDELSIVFALSAAAAILVTLASILSVYKPWSRLRLRRSTASSGGRDAVTLQGLEVENRLMNGLFKADSADLAHKQMTAGAPRVSTQRPRACDVAPVV